MHHRLLKISRESRELWIESFDSTDFLSTSTHLLFALSIFPTVQDASIVAMRTSLPSSLCRNAMAYRQNVFCLRQRQSCIDRFASSKENNNPLHLIESAISSLNDFSSRLVSLSELVDKPHILIDKNTGYIQNSTVTLPQIVLHSRDSNLKEFEQGAEARQLVLGTAIATDKELRSLAIAYESLSREMETGE